MKTTVLIAVVIGAGLMGVLQLVYPEVALGEYAAFVAVVSLLLAAAGRYLYRSRKKKESKHAHHEE